MARMAGKSGKQKAFKGSAKTPAKVVVNPKQPAKNNRYNLDMQSTKMSGASPKKASSVTVDPKSRNKQQLANIKQLAGMRYTQGDNPYKGK